MQATGAWLVTETEGSAGAGACAQVGMLAAQGLRCPITLEAPPLAPQITPCGHVFAFPAIMAHLLHHGGDSLRKASPCPLCFQPIVARALPAPSSRSNLAISAGQARPHQPALALPDRRAMKRLGQMRGIERRGLSDRWATP